MDPIDNLQDEHEGTLPVIPPNLDDLLDEAFSELDISSIQTVKSQLSKGISSKEPNIWPDPFSQYCSKDKIDYNDPAFWMKISHDIQNKVEQDTSNTPEPVKFLQSAFESIKNSKESKNESNTSTHSPKTTCFDEEGSIDPLMGVPKYSTLLELIKGRPPGFREQMLPLLYALNYSTPIPIPSFLSYSPSFEENIKINNVPLIGDLVGKYGYELAVGFGKLAIRNLFKTIPGIGIAITFCEVYSVYNRLMSSTITTSVPIGSKDFSTTNQNDIEQEITLSALSDEALVKKLIDLSDDVPTPILIGEFPTHVIGIFKDDIFGIAPRVCMLSRAESAVTYDMCLPFKHYSNQQLAQKLVDIACGVEIHPAFVSRVPHIIGTYKHTHLKQVNEVYSALCNDYRFEAEVHYRNGVKLTVEGKLPGFSKDSIRVDLRTNIKYQGSFEVYDLKTGFQGITFKQVENYKRHLPEDVIYEVRPNWDKPYQVHPIDERRITSIK